MRALDFLKCRDIGCIPIGPPIPSRTELANEAPQRSTWLKPPKGKHARPDGPSAAARRAIAALAGEGRSFATSEVVARAIEAGGTQHTTYVVLTKFYQSKLVRRVSPGTYRPTAKLIEQLSNAGE